MSVVIEVALWQGQFVLGYFSVMIRSGLARYFGCLDYVWSTS